MVFISVNTPTKKHGLGAGKASDLRWVEACARQVADNALGHTIVVKSTLPVRTAEVIKAILQDKNINKEEKKLLKLLMFYLIQNFLQKELQLKIFNR